MRFNSGLRRPLKHPRVVCSASQEPQASKTRLPVVDIGSFSVLGTSRKANEDRFDYKVSFKHVCGVGDHCDRGTLKVGITAADKCE